jgi:hypothetical protein
MQIPDSSPAKLAFSLTRPFAGKNEMHDHRQDNQENEIE